MASPTRFPAGVSTQAVGQPLGQYPLPDPTEVYTHFDDFNAYRAAEWTVTNTTSHATIGILQGRGGLLSLAGSGTSVTADIAAVIATPFDFNFLSTQPVWFFTSIQATTAINDQIQVGITGANSTLAPTDGIYFNKAAGSTSIDFVVAKSSALTTQAAVATLANATSIQLAFYYNAKDAVDVFVNGTKVYSQTVLTNLPSSVALATAFGLKAAATSPTTSNLVIDYALAAQGR